MLIEIISLNDLKEFKSEIIDEIKQTIKKELGNPSKKWIKSNEARKILNISSGTLQNLRVNGTLPFTKIGGVIYYDNADIQQMLIGKKQKASHVTSN